MEVRKLEQVAHKPLRIEVLAHSIVVEQRQVVAHIELEVEHKLAVMVGPGKLVAELGRLVLVEVEHRHSVLRLARVVV